MSNVNWEGAEEKNLVHDLTSMMATERARREWRRSWRCKVVTSGRNTRICAYFLGPDWWRWLRSGRRIPAKTLHLV